MTFSIIIPVYNRDQVITRSIDSVLSQTFVDFELLLIDDGSTDNSIDIMERFSNRDSRVKIYKTPKNSGPAVARNIGINLSRGKYISFLDSDDYFEANFLECTHKKISTTAPDVGFMWTGLRVFRKKQDQLISSVEQWEPKKLSSPYLTFLHSLHIGTNSGITVKKEVFDKLGCFREDLLAAEDTELFLRITKDFDYSFTKQVLINIDKSREDRLSNKLDKIADAYNRFITEHLSVIDSYPALVKKYYYKLMYLNYHIGNYKLARKYLFILFRNRYFNLKILSIPILFELFGIEVARRLHLSISRLGIINAG